MELEELDSLATEDRAVELTEQVVKMKAKRKYQNKNLKKS